MTQIKDEISKIQYIEKILVIHAIYLGWIPLIFKILIRGFLSSKSTILDEIIKIIARVIFSNVKYFRIQDFYDFRNFEVLRKIPDF